MCASVIEPFSMFTKLVESTYKEYLEDLGIKQDIIYLGDNKFVLTDTNIKNNKMKARLITCQINDGILSYTEGEPVDVENI